MQDHSDNYGELIRRIQSGDHNAFEELFHLYYPQLCVFSNSYVKSLDLARDVVQDVLIKIWDNRENLQITHSLKAYLYMSVRNQSLNFIQQKKQIERLEKRLKKQLELNDFIIRDEQSTAELTIKVWKLVDKLPERRRTIFILYRKHGLSYSEISEVMGIARKTVENQMGKSLQFLREQLEL